MPVAIGQVSVVTVRMFCIVVINFPHTFTSSCTVGLVLPQNSVTGHPLLRNERHERSPAGRLTSPCYFAAPTQREGSEVSWPQKEPSSGNCVSSSGVLIPPNTSLQWKPLLQVIPLSRGNWSLPSGCHTETATELSVQTTVTCLGTEKSTYWPLNACFTWLSYWETAVPLNSVNELAFVKGRSRFFVCCGNWISKYQKNFSFQRVMKVPQSSWAKKPRLFQVTVFPNKRNTRRLSSIASPRRSVGRI
jgi:hypothetical protein